MPIIKYYCNFCHEKYSNLIDAEKCEEKHIINPKDLEIISCLSFKGGYSMPEEIIIQNKNGGTVKYIVK